MKATQSRSIFDPLVFNGLKLANSIVMAPMTRSRAIGFKPNRLMADYYAQRSGAGLIITEGTSPSADGLGYARTPGIFTSEQINGWKLVTDAVHAKGSKIFLQLLHVGRVAHPSNKPAGSRTLAPSAIAAAGTLWTDSAGLQEKENPIEMTLDDIDQCIQDFVTAARNAISAGFDGVELHGANGYLLEQFLNPNSNTRVDSYGGNAMNRAKFVVEVSEAVADAIGSHRVGLRISPYSTFNDMPLYTDIFETYAYLAKRVAELDLLYIHMVDYAARSTDEGNSLIRAVRNYFPNLLMLNGGYTKQRAVNALRIDRADLISFGSTFISNPDLPYRLQHDVPLSAPDANTFYTADAKGYIDYPVATAVDGSKVFTSL